MKLRAGDKWKRNFKHLPFDHSGASYFLGFPIQGNNPNFKLPQLLPVTHQWLDSSSIAIKCLTNNCQLLQSEFCLWGVNYSSVGFFHFMSVVPCRGAVVLLWMVPSQGGTEGAALWQPSLLGQKEVVLFPRQAFGTWPKPTLHSILCHTLDEMLEIRVHCCRSHWTFWKQMGITNDFWAASPPSHCNIPSVNRNGMSCWNLFHQPLLVASKLSLMAVSCHCCPTFTNRLSQEMLHDFRQTSLQTVQWGLILSFELSALSFSAGESAQHSRCLTSGNCEISLICFQWNFHRARLWHFLNK